MTRARKILLSAALAVVVLSAYFAWPAAADRGPVYGFGDQVAWVASTDILPSDLTVNAPAAYRVQCGAGAGGTSLYLKATDPGGDVEYWRLLGNDSPLTAGDLHTAAFLAQPGWSYNLQSDLASTRAHLTVDRIDDGEL